LQFIGVHLDHRKIMMRVICGASPGWEVLGASEDVLTALPAVEYPGIVDDLLISLAPAAAPEGVGGPGEVIDVEHRGKI
jgi:hypothetical protein